MRAFARASDGSSERKMGPHTGISSDPCAITAAPPVMVASTSRAGNTPSPARQHREIGGRHLLCRWAGPLLCHRDHDRWRNTFKRSVAHRIDDHRRRGPVVCPAPPRQRLRLRRCTTTFARSLTCRHLSSAATSALIYKSLAYAEESWWPEMPKITSALDGSRFHSARPVASTGEGPHLGKF
jgi:hypothetical protein